MLITKNYTGFESAMPCSSWGDMDPRSILQMLSKYGSSGQLSRLTIGHASLGKVASVLPIVFLAHFERRALVTTRQVRFLRRNSVC